MKERDRDRERQRDRDKETDIERERGVFFKLFPHFLSARSPVNIYYRKSGSLLHD